jgi:hypothetical protein
MSTATDGVSALERGEAYVDLSSWWKVGVDGTDAQGWLNDLLSAELDALAAGEARRSLLLTPTGRIRAAITVTVFNPGYLLLQDPIQPSRIDELLSPYVLSSDVALRDRTEELGLLAFPGARPPSIEGAAAVSPSVLGPGTDLITRGSAAPPIEGRAAARPEDVDAWRVRLGLARFGIDLDANSLPQETEPGELIAYGKGCFLGQEAVARIRNLGHPPFVLLAAEARGPVRAGERLLATALEGEPAREEEREAGTVTSAVSDPSRGTALIARVRWALKDAPLRTVSGVELRPRGLASAA